MGPPEWFPREKGVRRHLQTVQRRPCVDESSGDKSGRVSECCVYRAVSRLRELKAVKA